MNDTAADRLIDNPPALDALVERVRAAPAVAIDTEFVRERTYFPKLCLLQVATKDAIGCVDCLAELDLAPLFDSLFRPGCEWVLHSARQDLEIFWHCTARMPAQLFDTQLAAALLGFAPQLGLQELVAQKLGFELDKTMTRTDWTRRPLPPGALTYALDDVRHLLDLARLLRAELERLGRQGWYDEDADRLLADPPVSDPITIWQRLKGTGRLSQREQAAALALVRWRETEAQRADRPRRWILADEVLGRIARALPADLETLAAIPEMPHRLVGRSGTYILAAVADSASQQAADVVAAATPPRPDKSELQALQAEVKARAKQLSIHAEVLATRRDLAARLSGVGQSALSEGWRAKALGEA